MRRVLIILLAGPRILILAALAVSLSFHFVPAVWAQEPFNFPPTPKKPVSDEYYGIKVIDDYRWLEDVNVAGGRRGSDERNRFSRLALERISMRAAISDRLKDLYSARSAFYYNFYQRKMFFA